MTRTRVLEEALRADLLPVRQLPTPPNADGGKYYCYHQNLGHSTEDCVAFNDKIEELIRTGYLKKYVR